MDIGCKFQIFTYTKESYMMMKAWIIWSYLKMLNINALKWPSCSLKEYMYILLGRGEKIQFFIFFYNCRQIIKVNLKKKHAVLTQRLFSQQTAKIANWLKLSHLHLLYTWSKTHLYKFKSYQVHSVCLFFFFTINIRLKRSFQNGNDIIIMKSHSVDV